MLFSPQLLGGARRPLVLTALARAASNTSFTYALGGAAEANLYDGSDATAAADPAGANASTHVAYDFGSTKEVRRLRVITATSSGFNAQRTFDIGWSDTNLTTSFTNVDTIIIPSGTAQLVVKDIAAYGAHRYWRFFYASGATAGDAWLGEVTFYELV